MQKKAQTLRNKITVLVEARCTKRFLEALKLKINHPVLNCYQAIALRHRFVRGFSKDGIQGLTDVFDKMGELGIAHHKFPLGVGVLTDPSILSSAAFERQLDKDAVPQWRDGKAGHDLQLNMTVVLKKRYFDFGFWKQAEAKPFATATHWVAFACLVPYIESAIAQLKEEGARRARLVVDQDARVLEG